MREYARKLQNTNKGTTLVEMIVCFALMAIFVSAAAAIIASVTNMYYQIKGETYGRQISDIVIQRIVGEVEGAKIIRGGQEPKIDINYSSISLCNRTDTNTKVYSEGNELLIDYQGYTNKTGTRKSTTWKFDERVYYGYEVEELLFISGEDIGTTSTEGIKTHLQNYGLDADNLSYDSNIVLILLTLKSGKYGTYRTVRPVKMYNIPENYSWPTD